MVEYNVIIYPASISEAFFLRFQYKVIHKCCSAVEAANHMVTICLAHFGKINVIAFIDTR